MLNTLYLRHFLIPTPFILHDHNYNLSCACLLSTSAFTVALGRRSLKSSTSCITTVPCSRRWLNITDMLSSLFRHELSCTWALPDYLAVLLRLGSPHSRLIPNVPKLCAEQNQDARRYYSFTIWTLRRICSSQSPVPSWVPVQCYGETQGPVVLFRLLLPRSMN